jgi:hypothetical protein
MIQSLMERRAKAWSKPSPKEPTTEVPLEELQSEISFLTQLEAAEIKTVALLTRAVEDEKENLKSIRERKWKLQKSEIVVEKVGVKRSETKAQKRKRAVFKLTHAPETLTDEEIGLLKEVLE